MRLLSVVIGVTPVLLFLLSLMAIDSFKLVRPRSLMAVVVGGCAAAAVCFFVNTGLFRVLDLTPAALSRYVAPVVEELAKAVLVVLLIRRNRVGFLVDAAIYGFAVGSGFAAAENVYYLTLGPEMSVFAWIVRGFGTAVMHGGTTGVFAIVSKALHDRARNRAAVPLLPGLLLAIVVHSLFNHFLFSPFVSTIGIVVVVPVLTVLVFQRSEQITREWLGIGFDSDQELLGLIKSGEFSLSRIGRYLHSLRSRFPGETVADMLCWLRIRTELSIRAKGLMLMRDAGFKPPPDASVRAKLKELKYLERSIGPTGLLAIAPVVRASRTDLWQMQVLDQ